MLKAIPLHIFITKLNTIILYQAKNKYSSCALNSALMKLECTICRMEIGGIAYDSKPFPPDFCVCVCVWGGGECKSKETIFHAL